MFKISSKSSPSMSIWSAESNPSQSLNTLTTSVRSNTCPSSAFSIPQPEINSIDPQSPRSKYVSQNIDVEAKSRKGQLTNELLSRFNGLSALAEIKDLEMARFKIGLESRWLGLLQDLKKQTSFRRNHKSLIKKMTNQANNLISKTLDEFKGKYLIEPPESFGSVLKKQASLYLQNIDFVKKAHYGDQFLDRNIEKVTRNKKLLEQTELKATISDYNKILGDYKQQFMTQNDAFRRISVSQDEQQTAIENTFCYQVEHNHIQGVIDAIAARNLKTEPADTYFTKNRKCVDRFGHSVIDYAAYHGRLDFIKRFIEAGALAYSCFSEGQARGFQPIHWAAKAGHGQVVEYLCGYLIDQKKEKYISAKGGSVEYTPLHLALKNQHLDVVEILIKHDADVNSVALDNSTPVLLATRIFPVALKVLCARSIKANYKESQLHREKVDVAMDEALRNHDHDAIRLLAPCSTISTSRFLKLIDKATTDEDRKIIINEVFFRRMRWGMEERIQEELERSNHDSNDSSASVKIGSAFNNKEFIERKANLLVSECLETIKGSWIENVEGIPHALTRPSGDLVTSPRGNSRQDHSSSWVKGPKD